MKYLESYMRFKLFESKIDEITNQEIIDSINDILLDLIDEHKDNILLKCLLRQDYVEGGLHKSHYEWEYVDEFVPARSISFEINSDNSRSYLPRDEVFAMVETIKRVNDYIISSGEYLGVYIHYETRNLKTMTLETQECIDIEDIDNLLNDFSFIDFSFDSDDFFTTDKKHIDSISMTMNKS